MNTLTEAAVTIGLAVIGLAMVSVLVSRNANTSGVIQSAASGLGNVMGVAESPVTGAGIGYDLSYPSQAGYGLGS